MLPIKVLPLYVDNVNVIETEVPDVFWFAKLFGAVQLVLNVVDVAEEDPRIYPEALPQE